MRSPENKSPGRNFAFKGNIKTIPWTFGFTFSVNLLAIGKILTPCLEWGIFAALLSQSNLGLISRIRHQEGKRRKANSITYPKSN